MRAFCKRHKVLTFIVSFFIFGFIYLYTDLYPKHDPNAPTEVDGDPVPPRRHPFIYYFDQSLLGIDEDNDGVMDEFELWVNENIEESTERIVLKLLAKKKHELMEADSIRKLKEINQELNELHYCHELISIGEQSYHKYRDTFEYGNFSRRSFTQKISSLMSGAVGQSPSRIKDISTFCPFDQKTYEYFKAKKKDHKEMVIEKYKNYQK